MRSPQRHPLFTRKGLEESSRRLLPGGLAVAAGSGVGNRTVLQCGETQHGHEMVKTQWVTAPSDARGVWWGLCGHQT